MQAEAFFSQLDDTRRPIIENLDRVIREAAPDMAADRHVAGSEKMPMLAYGTYHYMYDSGREGDWFAVGIASQKNYISLYVCAVNEDGYMAEKYGKRLGNVSVGKSCIRFKKADDLNNDELVAILKDTQDWWRAQPKPTAA